MKRRLLAMGVVFFVGISLGARAQNPQTPAPQTGSTKAPQQPPPLNVTAVAVIVPVTVKDSDGRLVGDLTKDDFRILCDGIQQKLLFFSSDPFPLSAVVVLDNDLAQKQAEQVQKSLATVSAAFGPEDEVAVVTYEEFPTTISDFSNNNDLLFTELKRLDLGSHQAGGVIDPTTNPNPVINGRDVPNGQQQQATLGIPARGAGRYKNNNDLDDALYAAGKMLETRGRTRRKMIFLISDGVDSRNNRHTFDETLRVLLAADVSVYSISTAHSFVPVGKRILEHGVSEIDRFAYRTGGDTFFANKQNDLDRLYSDVTEEARNQYTLTFQPAGENHSRDYHSIEVRVLRPGLNVTTREGYYQSALTVGH